MGRGCGARVGVPACLPEALKSTNGTKFVMEAKCTHLFSKYLLAVRLA